VARGSVENTKKKAKLVFGVLALLSVTSCHRQAARTEEPPTEKRSSAEIIQDADRLYAARSDPQKVREALVVLRHAQLTDGGNYEVAWRLAKYNYYVGAHSSDEVEKEKVYRDGIEAGKLAVELQDAKPDGHFWLGANYGGNAETSTLAGLAEIEDIRHEMETVIKLDEKYESGSAYMVLGQTYLQAPMLFGGDREKAVVYLEKGLRLGPGNALLRLHLAEAYLAVNRKAEARKQIDALLAMKPDPNYLPEYDDAIAQARKVQDKLG